MGSTAPREGTFSHALWKVIISKLHYPFHSRRVFREEMRRQGILYSCWRELFGFLAVFPTFSCFFFPFQLPHQTPLHRTKKCYPKQIKLSSCNQSFPSPPSNLSCFPSRTLPNPRCPASSLSASTPASHRAPGVQPAPLRRLTLHIHPCLTQRPMASGAHMPCLAARVKPSCENGAIP